MKNTKHLRIKRIMQRNIFEVDCIYFFIFKKLIK